MRPAYRARSLPASAEEGASASLHQSTYTAHQSICIATLTAERNAAQLIRYEKPPRVQITRVIGKAINSSRSVHCFPNQRQA